MQYPYEAATEIQRAKIGVVWHTYYQGATFEKMSASFGVTTAAFKTVRQYGRSLLTSLIYLV